MTREQLQQKFRQAADRARSAAAGERRAAEATLKRMLKHAPWLRDYARLLGLSLMPGLTHEFPWLALPAKASAAKTRHTDALGRADRGGAVSKHRRKTTESRATATWVKPPTVAGFEYRQCYKPNCKCMNGGAWHGPYRYRKQRNGASVRSKYVRDEIASKQLN